MSVRTSTARIGRVATMVERRRARRAGRGQLPVVLAATWLVLVVLAAVVADWLPLPHYDIPVGPPRQPPGADAVHLLGTDEFGRSQLVRLMVGARVSLAVSVGAVLLSITAGCVLGLIAGFYARAATVIDLVLDAALAIPGLVLLLAMTAVLGSDLWTLGLGLAIISVPPFARLARAITLSYADREFVTASRVLGARGVRTLFREILPNLVLPVGSYAFVVVAWLMVTEGSLSFLGLGVPPPNPSWGGSIASGQSYLATDPHLVFLPAAVLLATIFAFNVVGDHFHDRFGVERPAGT
ncbi:ABC transporter permease [Pseudonocardia sp.]|uniref:ABC transporter permease n=1 Tax=Pseudonocardia sp. TaxID=60912 RepID=UPI00261DC873|nr:ABC transporter permease [Pseudonocardia sp.]